MVGIEFESKYDESLTPSLDFINVSPVKSVVLVMSYILQLGKCSNKSFSSLLLGAALAIIGGVVGEYLKTLIQNYWERRAMKIGLHDEIYSITDIIKRLTENYDKATPKIINSDYYTEMSKSVDCYNNHRLRLFLFKYSTKKAINEFYKDLKRFIEEHQTDIITLNVEEKPVKHATLIPLLKELKDKAIKILPLLSVSKRTHKED